MTARVLLRPWCWIAGHREVFFGLDLAGGVSWSWLECERCRWRHKADDVRWIARRIR